MVSTGNELPDPVVLGIDGRQPPTERIDAKPREFGIMNDGLDLSESLEGMRVQTRNACAISPESGFGAIWVVGDSVLAATGLNGGGSLTIAQNDFNLQRVQIDDDNARFLTCYLRRT